MSTLHRRRARRGHDEGGATIVLVAVMVAVIVGLSSFVVDVGLQRVARADMQTLSDVVAIDMARYIDGRNVQTIEADPQWTAQLNASINRNDSTTGDTPTVTAVLGNLDATGTFTELKGTDVPNAVEITSATTIGRPLAGSKAGVSRSAYGKTESVACFGADGFFLTAGRNQPLIGGLVASLLNVATALLPLGGLTDLVATPIPLTALQQELGAATSDEFLTKQVTVTEYLRAVSRALASRGKGSAAILASTVATIFDALPGNPTMSVGDFLTLGNSPASMNTSLRGIDLLLEGLLIGSPYAVNLSNLIAIPGVASLSGELTFSTPPQIGCGPVGTTVSSSQLHFKIAMGLGSPSGGLGAPAIGGVGTTVQFDLGSSTATLAAAGCRPTPQATINASTSLLKDFLVLVQFSALSQTLEAGYSLPGLLTTTAMPRTFVYPANGDLPPTQVVPGSTELGLSSMNVVLRANGVELLGGLNFLLSTVFSVVEAFVNPIMTTVYSTLADTLGLSLGGARVGMLSSLDCSTPVLVSAG